MTRAAERRLWEHSHWQAGDSRVRAGAGREERHTAVQPQSKPGTPRRQREHSRARRTPGHGSLASWRRSGFKQGPPFRQDTPGIEDRGPGWLRPTPASTWPDRPGRPRNGRHTGRRRAQSYRGGIRQAKGRSTPNSSTLAALWLPPKRALRSCHRPKGGAAVLDVPGSTAVTARIRAIHYGMPHLVAVTAFHATGGQNVTSGDGPAFAGPARARPPPRIVHASAV